MKSKSITMDHGSGGKASQDLIEEVFLPLLANSYLGQLDDSALVPLGEDTVAFTTDSYVVDPIFFPGGDIGCLSVYGTVNDLAMQGALPRYITLGLILEEGFPLQDLRRILESVSRASRRARVEVVAGDTKVVPRGKADKVYINTSGIGQVLPGVCVGADNARPGDAVIINGPMGDHGIAILSKREGLNLSVALESDCAPLNLMVTSLLEKFPQVHALRDPTRGGVATALNDVATSSSVGIVLEEERLPVRGPVKAVCELLGLDPLYIANEGKCLIFSPQDVVPGVLSHLKGFPEGRDATVIGKVTQENPGRVLLKTPVGGTRIVTTLTGEQLPRIC